MPSGSVHPLTRVFASLALVAGLILVGCAGNRPEEPSLSPTPAPTSTPWPTLAPVAEMATIPPPEGYQSPEPQQTPSGPTLVEQYRVNVDAATVAVFPLEGEINTPVRIEAIVLSGDLDPEIIINNVNGDRLAYANSGGVNQPEVVGQFLFPGDGFFELGIGAVEGEGEIGVSIYHLDEADLEGGGTFSSINQELAGSIEHPATFHTFRLPLERGQRVDLWATSLNEGLDLLFELYGPDGILLASRDDNIGKDPYLWNFMPAQSGTYTVVLSNFANGVGGYTLSVAPSAGGGEAELGIRTDLELLGSPRRSTWLTLPGRTLDGLYIETRPTSPGVDIHISIYDPYGNRLQVTNQNGPGLGEEMDLIMFPFDGQYQVEFQTLGESGTMQYYILPISQFDIDHGGKLIPGGQGRENTIEGPGSFIVYWFEGNQGDLIGIDAHATGSSGLDLAFDVFDPNGHFLFDRNDVVGRDPVIDRYELPTSGRFAIGVWNVNGTSGDFDIFVTNPAAPATPPPEE